MSKLPLLLLLLQLLLSTSVDATTNDAIACASFYNSQSGLNTQEQCAALRQYRNCLSLAEIGMDPSSAASFEQGFQIANQTLLTRGTDCSLYIAMPEINTQQGRIIMTSDVDVQVVVGGRATSLKQLAQTSDTQTTQLQQLQTTLATVNTSLTNQLASAVNDAAQSASTTAAATSTSLQQIQATATTTNTNVAAVSGLVVAAQQSLASQANSISTLSSTLGGVQTAAATTNTNVAAVSGLVVAAQQSLASQASSIGSLNNGLAQVTAQASTNAVNVAAISGLVVAAQQSIASANTNAAALSTTVSTVASVANTNVAELAHISALVIAAHININVSSGNITTLVNAVNQLQIQAGANTVNVAGISGLVVAAQQSIALNTNSINTLTTTVTQAQASAAATSSNLAALSTAHSTTVSNAAAQSTLLAAVSVRASQAAVDILALGGGAPAGTTVASLSTAVSTGQSTVAALSTATSASVTTLTTTITNLRGTGSSGATVEGLAAALSGLATGSSTNLASTAVRVDTVTSRLDLLVAQIQPVNAAISGTLTSFVAAMSADSSTYRQTVVNPLSSSVSNMQSCLQRSPPTLYDSVNNRCFPNFGLSDVDECQTNNGGCAQICINTLGGRSCACNSPQYVLNTDNITCVCGSGFSGVGCTNINECGTANGGCSQNCLDTAGSFTCSCNAGYVLGADNRTCLACAAGYTGTSCTPCAKGNYKSASGTNAACTACPTGTTTSGTGSTSVNDCNRVYWMQVGTLSNWDTVLANYPDSQWEYGSVHNGDIQLAYFNSWNLGTRITLYPFYPQQDTTNGLTFGTQVFTRGLSGDSTTQWISHYYRVIAGSGADYMAGSNGVVDPPLYVRKMFNPWVSVGTLANFWSIYNSGTFNQLNHELGIAYNGQIRPAHGNGWNVGMRLSTYPFYPQGDSGNSLTFGTAVFTYNLTGVAVNGWQQNYYDWPGNRYGGNGLSDTVSLFMRNRSAPWVFRGPVSALDSIRNQFPDTGFDLGMSHNGFVNGAFRNSWNSAKTDTRLYTIPFYPMGDAYNTLQFGYSVWGKGLQDHQDNTFAYYHYYYTANTNGFADTYWFSNGDVSVASIYTRTNRFPWVQVGNVSDIIYLRSIYPITEYEYGIRYKGDIQTTFWNGWNSGTRLTLYPIYPQGSVGTSFTMGTDIFTRGLNGAANANLWYEASYMYPDTFQTNDNIDNGVSIPVFVRPLSESPYPIGWGC